MENKTSITAGELQERISRKDAIVVLDVRDAEKFQAGTLELAGIQTKNIPYAALVEKEHVSELIENGVQVVTVCTTGNKANRAAVYLREKGVSAVSLEGGLTAWRESNNI